MAGLALGAELVFSNFNLLTILRQVLIIWPLRRFGNTEKLASFPKVTYFIKVTLCGPLCILMTLLLKTEYRKEVVLIL